MIINLLHMKLYLYKQQQLYLQLSQHLHMFYHLQPTANLQFLHQQVADAKHFPVGENAILDTELVSGLLPPISVKSKLANRGSI